MTDEKPRLTVIIPVYNDRENLLQCLDALDTSDLDSYELIVVDDGSTDGSEKVAQNRVDTWLTMQSNQGQAAARNLGAQKANADWLFFLDADITVETDTLSKIIRAIEQNPEFSAPFCSHQPDTPARNFLYRYRNILHHYTHQVSNTEAATFCGGFGAIKKDVFLGCGGFDPDRRFMEDVDLGYRLHQAGHRIRLCADIQLTHLKQYSLAGLIRSDVLQRAVPWTHVMLNRKVFRNDLNTSSNNILSLVLVYLMLLLLILPIEAGIKWSLEGLLLIVFWWLNRRFIGYVRRHCGSLFALKSLGMLAFQHFYSGIGVIIGIITFPWSKSSQ